MGWGSVFAGGTPYNQVPRIIICSALLGTFLIIVEFCFGKDQKVEALAAMTICRPRGLATARCEMAVVFSRLILSPILVIAKMDSFFDS